MPSPLVRHRRLATELRAERARAHVTAAQLAKKIHQSVPTVTRLERATTRPDMAMVMDYLAALNITGDRWEELVEMATQARERGWWDDYLPEIGTRQAMYANLEWGAKTITEYQIHVIPGLLQLREYITFRWSWDELTVADADGVRSLPPKMIDARLVRQRMLARQNGPRYTALIEEGAIRRLSAPPAVMARQLRHLIQYVDGDRITVRILPLEADLRDYWLPRSPAVIYTYDSGDPDTLAIDTEMIDHVTTEAEAVRPYAELFRRLESACLDPVKAATLLATMADDLATRSGSGD
ncbi:transcriptional regulator [Actinorhabdospora filicis]|uniref:Transcriptional regulator n=1 Tax=Actinorhabdospora filicis TaxID=1785913 RepID=A0A9W6WB55_9ACTN|nr:helix-turn-helix transcriptional regulator [Actinorhabdospora filicis]GLZ78365.1 transcriptional regulator [Actinorhabdospora filicis]